MRVLRSLICLLSSPCPGRRPICTLHELQTFICRDQQVDKWEDLKLGPIHKIPCEPCVRQGTCANPTAPHVNPRIGRMSLAGSGVIVSAAAHTAAHLCARASADVPLESALPPTLGTMDIVLGLHRTRN